MHHRKVQQRHLLEQYKCVHCIQNRYINICSLDTQQRANAGDQLWFQVTVNYLLLLYILENQMKTKATTNRQQTKSYTSKYNSAVNMLVLDFNAMHLGVAMQYQSNNSECYGKFEKQGEFIMFSKLDAPNCSQMFMWLLLPSLAMLLQLLLQLF